MSEEKNMNEKQTGEVRSIKVIADDLKECALAWEPDVCVQGNVRSKEVARLCDAVSTSYALIEKMADTLEHIQEYPHSDDYILDQEAMARNMLAKHKQWKEKP
ncbi:MAG TPA: hypothetical protein ENH82_09915 [bacterium]|nr:hypothetical protein [bacterium]